ncbi:MAG: methyltransferase domain-containing protein [Erythrobacter sp.]|nr:MAG: methyltransferase domain-containing protein [Erythrobacter sp.]
MDQAKSNREAKGLPEWKSRWVAWRNRLMASPDFQKWASAVWPVSLIARRRAGGLFDLVAGFAYSQTLLCAVESGLLDLLAEGPCDADAVAKHCDLSPDAALRLVRAAAALDLAEEVSPGWWMLGQQGAALHANPGAKAMIRHHKLLYADLADPLALLRADRQQETHLSRFWHYAAAENSAEAAAYSELMATSQALVSQQLLDAYDFSRHQALLDVGGGHGAFAKAVTARHPQLRIGVFDLPPVLESASLPAAFARHPGDFFKTPLPSGYDCITLNRILHDHDDEAAINILKASRRALPPGGRLVIAEPMANTPGAKPMGDAYFGLYLWAMNSGRPRTVDSIGTMLEEAGFARWKALRTRQPVIASAIVSFV